MSTSGHGFRLVVGAVQGSELYLTGASGAGSRVPRCTHRVKLRHGDGIDGDDGGGMRGI